MFCFRRQVPGSAREIVKRLLLTAAWVAHIVILFLTVSGTEQLEFGLFSFPFLVFPSADFRLGPGANHPTTTGLFDTFAAQVPPLVALLDSWTVSGTEQLVFVCFYSISFLSACFQLSSRETGAPAASSHRTAFYRRRVDSEWHGTASVCCYSLSLFRRQVLRPLDPRHCEPEPSRFDWHFGSAHHVSGYFLVEQCRK